MCFYPISEFIYRMFCNNISKFKPQFQSLSHGGTKSAEVYGVSRFATHRSPPGVWRIAASFIGVYVSKIYV